MTSRRNAFTLIELMIVVVIIGLLAAIAIPKFANTKGKANATALKTDLRNLATAEEAYFYSNNRYSNNLDTLNFRPSPGVIITIVEADGKGWSASVTHPQSYPLKCALFMSGAAPLPPATSEGIIACI